MEHTFKVGDVITLKSGGIKMTVTEIPAPPAEVLFVIYSDNEGIIRNEVVPVIAAEIYDATIYETNQFGNRVALGRH